MIIAANSTVDRGLNPAEFIRANLPLVPVPAIPEIRLHKAQPSSGLRQLAERDAACFGPPYWAYYWGGGLALARYLLDHPETVAGRGLLDLGAGSGIVAIAAAKAGARHVIAAEVDPYAIAALELNAAANDVPVSILAGDVLDGPPPPVDIVLVGDLFYDRATADRVTAFLDRCLASAIGVLVGDPWRAFLPRDRLCLLAEYRVSETGGATTKPAAVFAFGGGRRPIPRSPRQKPKLTRTAPPISSGYQAIFPGSLRQ